MLPFFLKRLLTLELNEIDSNIILSFSIMQKAVKSVAVVNKSIILDNENRLSGKEFDKLLDLINKTQPELVGGKILFNRKVLPELLTIFRQLPLRNEISQKLIDYKIEPESDKIKPTMDYVLDFVPGVGVKKNPALFIYDRGVDVRFPYGEFIKVILKNKVRFYDFNWIENVEDKTFIKLNEVVYKGLERSIELKTNSRETYELLTESSRFNKKAKTENFEKASITELFLINYLTFKDDQLVSNIKPAVAWSPKYPRGEVIEAEIKLTERGAPPIHIKDFEVFHFQEYNYGHISKKLIEVGFKKMEPFLFGLNSFDLIVSLITKLAKHKTVYDLHFELDETLQSIVISDDEVETLVSVKLEKGLVYLDVDYYSKKFTIDRSTILKAIENKSSIVQVKNKLLKLDYERIKKIEKGIEEERVLPLDKYYRALALTRLSNKAIYSESYKKFFDNLTRQRDLPYRALPKILRASVAVQPHQQIGFRWLSALADYGLNGILADEMGLGKTLQSLLTIFVSKDFYRGLNIIVCPKSLVENWRNEIESFFKFPNVFIHFGSKRAKKINKSESLGKIIITTYEVIRADYKIFFDLNINYLVLDEAQRIKNPDSQTAKAIKIIPARHKIAVTGTPIENRLSELWSIFDFLMPGFWGTRTEFRKRYEIPILKHEDEGALRELRELTRPLILRRTVNEILKLPGLIPGIRSCDLFEEQLSIYKKLLRSPMARKIIKDIKKDRLKPTSAAVLMLLQKLRMVCSHPDLITKVGRDGTRSGKMTVLFHVLQDLLADESNRILIFIEFRRNFVFLEEWLKKNGISYLVMHGETSPSERMENVRKFNKGQAQVFLVGLKVGAFGLNLTKANYVLLFDRWWNPAVESQAAARAYRLGQKRVVTVYRFVTKGTIEERLEDLHVKKKELFKGVFETQRLYEKLTKEDALSLLNQPSEKASVEK